MLLPSPLFLPEGLSRREQVDAEALCRRIFQRSRLELRFHDEEDAVSYLIECCWELSTDYRPGVIRKGFGAYATIALGRELVNWQRKRFGRTTWQFKDRTYERPRPVFASLDELPERGGTVDAETDRLSSLLGLDGPGDRGSLRRERALGEPPGRVAA